MKLSSRVRYAARGLTELAAVYPDGTASLRDVAKCQGVSSKYLERIFSTLRTSGLIRAVRGMKGGYALAKPPATITLREIYLILEGSLAPVDCIKTPKTCPRVGVCPTRDIWIELEHAMAGVLEQTTLQDLVERQAQKAESFQLMYHI